MVVPHVVAMLENLKLNQHFSYFTLIDLIKSYLFMTCLITEGKSMVLMPLEMFCDN